MNKRWTKVQQWRSNHLKLQILIQTILKEHMEVEVIQEQNIVENTCRPSFAPLFTSLLTPPLASVHVSVRLRSCLRSLFVSVCGDAFHPQLPPPPLAPNHHLQLPPPPPMILQCPKSQHQISTETWRRIRKLF